VKESRRSAEWIEPRIVEDRRMAQTYGLLPDELPDPFAAAFDQVHVWRRVVASTRSPRRGAKPFASKALRTRSCAVCRSISVPLQNPKVLALRSSDESVRSADTALATVQRWGNGSLEVSGRLNHGLLVLAFFRIR
jgi:hypothetical protein